MRPESDHFRAIRERVAHILRYTLAPVLIAGALAAAACSAPRGDSSAGTSSNLILTTDTVCDHTTFEDDCYYDPNTQEYFAIGCDPDLDRTTVDRCGPTIGCTAQKGEGWSEATCERYCDHSTCERAANGEQVALSCNDQGLIEPAPCGARTCVLMDTDASDASCEDLAERPVVEYADIACDQESFADSCTYVPDSMEWIAVGCNDNIVTYTHCAAGTCAYAPDEQGNLQAVCLKPQLR